MKRLAFAACIMALTLAAVSADAATFTKAPTVSSTGADVTIEFAVDGATDVEVAVLDKDGNVVRHLAAGVLGGESPPPAPLKAGLSQSIAWDRTDDAGKPVDSAAGVRVRLGIKPKFGRMIGQNPYAMGRVDSIAADAKGNVFLLAVSGGTGSFKQIVQLDNDGQYVRTLLPFPANLSPDRISNWARYDDAPRPINQNGLGPEFYTNAELTLLRSADEKGVLLTDGRSLYHIGFDGGMVGDSWKVGPMWAKKALPNTGGGPTFLAVSPDGKYLYLSGPYSSNTAYGHKADADFPPGQVYRMELGKGTMEPFVKLPTTGHNPAKAGVSWWNKHIKAHGNYTSPHGPIHDVAVDKTGRVYVCDQDNQRVAVFDAAGKQTAEFEVPYPDQIAVHPKTGEIYVLTRQILSYQKYEKKLLKFAPLEKVKQLAELDLGTDKNSWPQMVLVPGKKTVVWISGVAGGTVQIADKGAELAVAGDLKSRLDGELVLGNVDKIAVDYEKDLVYVSNAWSNYTRFDGLTGEGEPVKFPNGVSATDLVIGPGGVIFAQLGPGYSGPLARFDRDMKPAPFEAMDSHVMSNYIYGRYHGQGGNCEKGMGVGPDGSLYTYWMCGGWVQYGVTRWGADGKPINGEYGKIDEGHYKKGTPKELTRPVIYPVLAAGGGVRVDSKGCIYVGQGVHTDGYQPPAGFEKDAGYSKLVGSIVRFGPGGGAFVAVKGKDAKVPEGALKVNGSNYFVGADKAFEGMGPMSGGHVDAGSFGNIAFCVCRVPRFDIDRYDRIYIPNAVTNSVRVVDRNGNRICEFGSYGNFDSQGPGSAVPTPDIPLGWPMGVGVSEKHIYVGDIYNRRVVRVDSAWSAEKVTPIK